jgi:hypothetical protein
MAHDIPDVPDIPSIIVKWPPEGHALLEARQRMPSYGYKVPVGPAIRAQGPRAVCYYAERTMFQMCEKELRQMLGSSLLVLVGYRIGQPDQPVVVAAARISGLQFDFDPNSVQFDDGLILRGCTIYSAAHWRARPKEPLLIEAVGPLPLFTWSEQRTPADEDFTAKVKAPIGSTHPGDNSAKACTRKFPVDLMRADPSNKAQHSKAELKAECRGQCGEISDRAFDQIWAACIDETGAAAYKKSGPRGPHQARRQSK